MTSICESGPSLRKIFASLTCILIFVAWLYAPFVNYGLPYFYDEDEGHHYDRVIDMLKEGTFNPKYFLKPSLHFYLRMPVSAAAFLHIAKKGEIKSLQEIKTRDKFGLAGRAYTTSHPFIAKANRAFSLCLTLSSIALVFFIALLLTSSVGAASFSAILTALSPTLAERSAFIGVDGPTLFFCLLTVYLALRLQKKFSYTLLILSTLAAGFTVSSKYNAAPILIIPCLAYLLSGRRKTWDIILALILPICAFFLASPYILLSIPLFLDHVAYEMWHYKTGHIGHEADPGFAQLVFYLKWLWQDGWHILPLLALAGLFFFLKGTQRKAAIVLIAFPALYGALMLMQRVNFTRNLIVVLPFIAILVGYFLHRLYLRFASSKNIFWFGSATALILCIYPLILTLNVRNAATLNVDSRNEAFNWLLKNRSQDGIEEIALSGKLQLPLFTSTINRETEVILNGIVRTDSSIFDLYQSGYDKIVFGPEQKLSKDKKALLNIEKLIPGNKEKDQRIYKNPEIIIATYKTDDLSKQKLRDYVSQYKLIDTLELPSSDKEIWLQKRITALSFDMKKIGKTDHITLRFYNPWDSQTITFRMMSWQQTCKAEHGQWSSCTIKPPMLINKDNKLKLLVEIERVHSPHSFNPDGDKRRLGLQLEIVK